MPQTEMSLEEFEEKARERYGVPKALWSVLADQESGGDVNAVSPTGVRGRRQVTQATARAYNLDRDDPFQAAVASAKNLREGYDRYKDQFDDDNQRWLAASAYYYRGPSAVKSDGTFEESSADGLSTAADYVTSIAKRWKAYNDGQATPAQSQAELMSRGLLPGMEEPKPQRRTAPLTARDKALYGRSALQGLRDPHAAEKAQFEQQPLLDRTLQRGGDALMRGVGHLSKMARQATQAGTAINRKLGLPAPKDDAALEGWKRREEEQRQFYEQRRVRRPSSLTTDIAEGVVEAVPAAGAAIGGTMLTGGGLPAAALIGGGMGAAGADWNDPGRAALQTAIGAAGPLGGRLAGAAASRLASPAARAATEIGAGAATNVAGTAAEQAIFEGALDPRALAVSGAVGGALSVPGAVAAARAPRVTAEASTTIPDVAGAPAQAGVRVFRQGEQIPARARGERQIAIDIAKPDGSVETVMVIAPRGMNEADIRTAAEQSANPVEQAAPTFDDVIADSQSRIQQSLTNGDTNAADIELSVFNQSIKDQYSDAVKAAKGNPAARAAAQRVRAQQMRGADELKQQVEARKQQLQQPTEELEQVPTDPTAELTARIPNAPDTQQFRTPEGAIIAPPLSLPSRRLLPPAPSAPETQQIPGVPRTIRAEDEPTGRFQTGRLPVAAENAPSDSLLNQAKRALAEFGENAADRKGAVSILQRRLKIGYNRAVGLIEQLKADRARQFITEEPTAELTRPQGALPGQETPVAVAQRRTATLQRSPIAPEQRQNIAPLTVTPDILAATQEPTNRISEGPGSELQRYSRPLEGQPVELPRPTPRAPRATPENIDALRSRYADLDRLRFDRQGELTRDLSDEARELGSVIADYDNRQARQGGRFNPDAEPPYTRQSPEKPMTAAEKAARRAALQPRPRTSGLLQSSTPGRPVTQEVQIPSSRNPRTDFSSREDARRGYFDTLTDTELLAEIGRLEDVQNRAVGGRAKLSPQELEAARFDHKIAVEQQKERYQVQKAQGRDPGEMIAPRTPGQRAQKAPRVIQHEQFGEVAEMADQSGVSRGKLRVVRKDGVKHEIQNPRTKGNRVAAFVKPQESPTPTPRPGAQGPAVDRPMAMEISGKPTTPRPQTQFEGEAAAYTGRKDRYKRETVYEIEMTEGSSKGQKRWVKTAPKVEQSQPSGNQFVRKMLEIKPSSRTGAPVQITELRKQFPNLNKEAFDVEMLKLAEEGKIGLHRHDYASSLSEADRSALVREKKRTKLSPGEDPYNYFIAATIPEGRGHIMGMGLGSLQGLFKGRKAPSANQSSADIEGASLGKAIGAVLRTGAQGLRTIKTSFDLSAPLGQAAFLTIPHPLKSARSFGQMLRSLKPSQSDAIDAEIAFHPLRKLGEEAGLYVATSAKLKGDAAGGEEAFMVKGLNRVPGIGASERTYRTYLDTLRMSVWEGYVKSLQADGYTWENNPKAYRDAAAGINIASGRGSIKKGGKIEKAMDLGGDILFSPRNFVAKFQRLDPVRYAALAPGARKLVLRDALTTFGVMLGTAALLKARGANISLNPEDDNFMVARLGDTRYDLTVGAKTQVQFLARMAMGAYRKKTGEGNLPYKDPLSVAASFMRNQLAPGLSLAIDAIKGEDFKGEKFSDKSTGKIARETIAPMMVDDFYEAYEKEGKVGVAKALPAIVGARVSTYPDKAKAAFLDAPTELRSEQKQAGMTRSLLTPKKGEANNKADDETPAQFATRKARANEWTTKYGRELVGSQAYKSASTEEKKAALEYIKEKIAGQSDEKRPSLYLLNPARILATIRQSAREKQRKAARAGM